jgi:hypothetical protein
MEFKKILTSVQPHLIAVILFIIISFAYFYPVLEGKVLKANDSTVSVINSKEINDYRAEFGKEPLWTNSIFSGMPAYLISTRFPGNLLKQVDRVIRIFKMPVSVLFLSMVGFYLLLLIFGVDPWLSIVGAIAYGFSSFFFQILAAGHNTQAIALAYMAPMIGGIYYTYRYDAIKGALLTGFMLSLEILANHPQITYYAMICLLIFVITEFIFSIRNKTINNFLKRSLLLLVPFIIAIGINFGNLYTIQEYGKYSIRGKSDLKIETENVSSGLDRDYITYWSYGVDETLNLLIPNFKGGSSKPFDRDSETLKALRQNNAGSYANSIMKYWGSQPGTDGPHYFGAIVIFLFVLGLIIIKGPEKWWLLIATILSILLAWGKNFASFTNLFIDYFPGYNKFRAVTMTLVIAQFCMPLLGILALRNIYNGTLSKKVILKGIKIALAITGGILLLIMIIPNIAGSFLNQYETAGYPAWLTSALISDRKGLLRADSFRSLAFILLGAATIYGFISGKVKKEYSIMLFGILVLLDLWSAGKRYLGADRFERPSVIQKAFLPSTADAIILEDPSYYRVLNLSVSTFNDNTPTAWFHKSIGGYHGAKLKRYQELIDSAISRELASFGSAAETAQSVDDLMPVFETTYALNMLNAKYVIYNPDAPPLVNEHSLGNVWFAEKPLIVENANTELSAIKNINPSKEAVIDNKFKDQVTEKSYQTSENDKIELVSYQPNELVYNYSADGERLAVFSEIYYPAGWICYIDGTESNYFRTDYVLRGMILPAGTHEVKFSFKPSSYYVGNKVSLASSVILILLTAGYLISPFFRKSKK